MLKLRKLDARGIAHHFALAVIIVGLAVFGVYRLVASHADTCTGMSDPVSGQVSNPVSGGCTGTSAPTSGAVSYTGSCSISGVPTTVFAGDTFTAKLTVTNT